MGNADYNIFAGADLICEEFCRFSNIILNIFDVSAGIVFFFERKKKHKKYVDLLLQRREKKNEASFRDDNRCAVHWYIEMVGQLQRQIYFQIGIYER